MARRAASAWPLRVCERGAAGRVAADYFMGKTRRRRGSYDTPNHLHPNAAAKPLLPRLACRKRKLIAGRSKTLNFKCVQRYFVERRQLMTQIDVIRDRAHQGR